MNAIRVLASSLAAFLVFCFAAQAQETDLAVNAEQMRSSLIATQLALGLDSAEANSEFRRAQEAFRLLSLDQAALAMPDVLQHVSNTFKEARAALGRSDEAAFAAARTHIWMGVLGLAYRALERAVTTGELVQAQRWLGVREYRSATRFALPGAEATLALEALRTKQVSLEDGLTAIRSDFLDAYQARLEEALRGLEEAIAQPFLVRRAELAALAQGYFQILAPSYERMRGPVSLANARLAFASLGRSGTSSSELQAVRKVLEGFRAAPLSPRDRSRRASGIFRFLSLVPIEYERGVAEDSGLTRVVKDLEITEAVAFYTSALNAFTDLVPLLSTFDPNGLKEAHGLFDRLGQRLSAAVKHQSPPSLALVSENVRALSAVLERLIPSDWRRADPAGDLDVIREQLRAIINAAGRGDLELAETTRLDAYAILESGPEARLRVFAPQLSTEIEELFWNSVEPKGFARLIREQAPAEVFRTTRVALEAKLQEAAQIVGTNSAPAVVFTNSLVIVFREGFEAVLILQRS